MHAEHFTEKELACPCCGQVRFDPEARAMFNEARELSGCAYVPNSACRCQRHNAEVGGKADSAHLIGDGRKATAMDIKALTSRRRFLVLRGLIGAGFTRIGIGKTFIHADADKSKPARVAWLY